MGMAKLACRFPPAERCIGPAAAADGIGADGVVSSAQLLAPFGGEPPTGPFPAGRAGRRGPAGQLPSGTAAGVRRGEVGRRSAGPPGRHSRARRHRLRPRPGAQSDDGRLQQIQRPPAAGPPHQHHLQHDDEPAGRRVAPSAPTRSRRPSLRRGCGERRHSAVRGRRRLAAQVLKETEAAGDDGIEMEALCQRYTLDVVSAVAFGMEANAIENPDSELPTRARGLVWRPAPWRVLLRAAAGRLGLARWLPAGPTIAGRGGRLLCPGDAGCGGAAAADWRPSKAGRAAAAAGPPL